MHSIRALTGPLFLSLLPFSIVQAADKPALISSGTHPLSVVKIHDRVNYIVSLNLNNGKTVKQWRSVELKSVFSPSLVITTGRVI